MPLTIADDNAMRDLVSAISAHDGVRVARLTASLAKANKISLVRKVCMKCAAMACPSQCDALVELFKRPSAKVNAKDIADAVATIMYGARTRKTCSKVSKERPRIIVDELISRGGRNSELLSSLPSSMGSSWAPIVALCVDSADNECEQTPMLCNDRLRELVSSSRTGCDGAMEDLKMCAIWTYSRLRAHNRPIPSRNIPTGERQVTYSCDLGEPYVVECHHAQN